MPHVSLTLSGLESTVSRPVVTNIVQQICRVTGLDPSIRMVWPGDTETAINQGGSIDDKSKDAIFTPTKSIYINVKETPDIDKIGPTTTKRKDHLPIWADPKLGVTVSPVLISVEVELEFTYVTNNPGEADRWRRDMVLRLAEYRDQIPHSVDFNYSVPGFIVDLLQCIHANREAEAGYGEDFLTYFNKHSSPGFTVLGDIVAKNTVLSVAVRQSRIMGYFDMDAIPEKATYSKDDGTYTIVFPYKFSYLYPWAMNAKYPISVHNNMLPPGLVEFNDKGYNTRMVQKHYTGCLADISYFESDRRQELLRTDNGYLRYPSYDDFEFPMTTTGTGTVWSALVSVGPDKRSLLGLDDFPSHRVKDAVWAFMKESERTYMTKMYQSILQLNLYQDGDMLSYDTLTITPDMQVVSNVDLDPRKCYHVRLSIVADITLLPLSAFERLKNYPIALIILINAVNTALRDFVDLAKLADSSRVSDMDFNLIYRVISGTTGKTGYDPQINWANRGEGKPGILIGDLDKAVRALRNKQLRMRTVMATSIMTHRL